MIPNEMRRDDGIGKHTTRAREYELESCIRGAGRLTTERNMLWMHTRAFTSDGSSLMSSSRRVKSPLLDASHMSLMSAPVYSREGECCRWDILAHTLSHSSSTQPSPVRTQNEREFQLCPMHRCLLYLAYTTTVCIPQQMNQETKA